MAEKVLVELPNDLAEQVRVVAASTRRSFDEVLVDFETWAAVMVEASLAVGVRTEAVGVAVGFRIFTNAFDIQRDNDDSSEENVWRMFLGGPFVELNVGF